MELKVWQGGRASFERLRANNMLESGKVYFVGNSESSAEGLFSSSKGVIFVGIGLASAVQFGTFEEGEDLTEVIERIKSEIETLKKQADSVSQRLADEIRTNTEKFAQIDEALTNKAEQSQVDEIEKAVESKAEQTQVDAIESVVLVHVDQIDALQKNKADLGEDGKILPSQIPGTVDQIIEYPTFDDFPVVGEQGKMYLDLETNKTYRWSGSQYVQISGGLSLGETSETAFRGDYGKVAYDHTKRRDNPHEVTKGQIGLGNVEDTADKDKNVNSAQKDGDGNVISETYSKKSETQAVADAITETNESVSLIASSLTKTQGDVEALQNGKADKTEIETLASDISSNATSITLLQGSKADKSELASVAKKVDDNANNLANLSNSVSENSANIESVEGKVADIENVNAEQGQSITQLASDIDGIEKTLQGKADKAEVESLSESVSRNEEAVNNLSLLKADKTALNELQNDLNDLAESVEAKNNGQDAAITFLQNKTAEQTQAITEIQNGKADRSELANYETDGIPESEILSICKL